MGEDVLGLPLELVRELFDEPRSSERIRDVDHARFLGDDLLRAQGEASGVLARQGERFVEGVGVEALRATEHTRQRLDGHPDEVDLGLLGRQRHAGSLGVEAQLRGAAVPGPVAVAHPAGPDTAGRPVLRDLFEEVDVRVEEEAEAGGEVVDGRTGCDRRLHVREAVGECERVLLGRRRPGFADVVARDRHGERGTIEKLLDTTSGSDIWKNNNFVVVNLHDVNTEMKKTIPLMIAKKQYNDQKYRPKQ